MAVTEPPQDATPAKRPGRPRKAATTAETVAPVPAKRPGRPRKVATMAETVAPVPRRPGRPRKTMVDPRSQPEPPIADGEIEEKQIIPGQHGGYRPNSGNRKASASYEALAKARAKNEIFKANLAELEFKKRTGQLLPVEEVIRVWTEQVHIAKERLLSIPTRIAPNILRMTELRDVEHCLREVLHAVLEELSRGDIRQP